MADHADKATGDHQETSASAAVQGDPRASQPLYVTEAPTGRRRKRLIIIAILLVLCTVAMPYGWQLWHYYRIHESTDDAYVVGDIMPMSARVNGTVLSVHVEDHQQVEAGQLLVQLDPRDFATRVQQAEAAVGVAMARLRQAEIEVEREQESTSSDTARTSAALRAVQSTLQETQHSTEEAQARLRALEAAVA